MPVRRVPDLARWAFVAALFAAFAFVALGVWPAWAGCPTALLLFVGAWWIGRRDDAAHAEDAAAQAPTPDEIAAREAARETDRAAYQEEAAEHKRVERALATILTRERVPFGYRRPMGGHMDKRQGDYDLEAPLPVTAADLAALNGPLTRVETITAPDGRVALTRLSARDRHGGGIEVAARR